MKKVILIALIFVVFACKKDKEDTNSAPAPVAKFTIQTNDGVAPENIKFTNQSTNAEDFIWFFDDGQASMEYSPTHQFKRGGEYTVFLKVFGPGGKDSIEQKLNLSEPATLYQIKNNIPVTLDNVRSFYLDWDNSLVYDIIDHGSMAEGVLSEIIPTNKESIEVLFYVEGTYYQMAFPDPIVKDLLNTITIYDTSSCWTFTEDPISSTSMVNDFNKKIIRAGDILK